MSRRSWWLDGSIACAVAVSGVLEAVWGIDASRQQGPVWAQTSLYVVTGGLLVLRRWRPLLTLALVVAVSALEFAVFGAPEGMGVALPGLVAGYSVARWEVRRPIWWGLVLLIAHWLVWSGFDPAYSHVWERWLYGAPWAMLWVIAWLVGALVRGRARAAEQNRIAREHEAAQAVAEERNRIAREIHDVIGHSVSVMTVQASAVRRRLRPDQDVEREALRTVEGVGREALAEMRRMIGVLRQPGSWEDREPAPGLDQLARLVGKVRTAGLPVQVAVSGRASALPPGLDLAAYRLIQEGLTNALRHAVNATRADVHVEYREDQVRIEVRNDGAPVHAVSEGGHGLVGMRERVAVYGGSLEARPLPEGGFVLVAAFPVEQLPGLEDA